MTPLPGPGTMTQAADAVARTTGIMGPGQDRAFAVLAFPNDGTARAGVYITSLTDPVELAAVLRRQADAILAGAGVGMPL